MITTVPSLTVRPWAVAMELRARAFEAGGADGLAAYGWFFTQLFANPGATQIQAQAAYTTWSNANGNLIYFGNWVKWCIARLPAGYSQDWAGLKSYIATKTLAAWMGEATEYSDGYRVSGNVPPTDMRGVTVTLDGDTAFYSCPTNSATEIRANGHGYEFINLCEQP